MKRLAFGLAVLVFMGLFVLGSPALGQRGGLPHENPATARNMPETSDLLLSYVSALNLISDRQYESAGNILDELGAAELPRELRDIMADYRRISADLLSALNQAERLLDSASGFFREGVPDKAADSLQEAEEALGSAARLLGDLETATGTMVGTMTALPSATGERFQQAEQLLDNSLESINRIINKLYLLCEEQGNTPGAGITTSYYLPASLTIVNVPATIYPGLPFTVTGAVTSPDGYASRPVRVSLNNLVLAEESVPGPFSLVVTAPPELPDGAHTLSVQISRQDAPDTYAAAAYRQTVSVARLPVEARASLPTSAVMPRTLTVSGAVYRNEQPLPDAQVTLSFSGQSVSEISGGDGSFSLALKPNRITVRTPVASNPFYTTITTMDTFFDFTLVGWRTVTLTVKPAEPWYAPLVMRGRVFTVNPLTVSLLLAALLTAGWLLYRDRRVAVPAAPAPPSVTVPAATRPQPGSTPACPSEKHRLLSSYRDTVRLIETNTGLTIPAASTLREFLKAAAPHLRAAAAPFAELTSLAETALYAASPVDGALAERARSLAAVIAKELNDGTA